MNYFNLKIKMVIKISKFLHLMMAVKKIKNDKIIFYKIKKIYRK